MLYDSYLYFYKRRVAVFSCHQYAYLSFMFLYDKNNYSEKHNDSGLCSLLFITLTVRFSDIIPSWSVPSFCWPVMFHKVSTSLSVDMVLLLNRSWNLIIWSTLSSVLYSQKRISYYPVFMLVFIVWEDLFSPCSSLVPARQFICFIWPWRN